MITVRTQLLDALTHCAAGADDRHSDRLGKILFRPKEIVACNGHVLARIPCIGPDEAFAVSRSAIEMAVAAQAALWSGRGPASPLYYESGELAGAHFAQLRGGNRELRLGVHDGSVVIDVGYTSADADRKTPPKHALVVPRLDPADYPNVDPATPSEKGADSSGPGPVSFDCKYLVLVRRIARELDPSGVGFVRLVSWGADVDPHLFYVGGGGRVVVMPSRFL
jgi:hypothetical protein